MSKFSVKKPFTVFVAVIAVLVLGVVSYFSMTPDLLPNMDFPYVVIMTTYPGASPEKVENEITRPMEQSMATLEHIKEISSTSSENYSMVMLEFYEDVNLDTIGVDIQQSISALSAAWSDMVGTPYVLKINPSLLPIEVAAVSMDGMDMVQLTEFLDNELMNKLEGISGVARISTTGAVKQTLHIVLDQKKIDEANKTISDAINAKMDEALAELNKTKSELEDAKAKMEEAKEKLDAGKQQLADKVAEGEAELNYQQSQLVITRSELKDQLAQLKTAKSQLEMTISVLKPLQSGINELQAQVENLDKMIADLEALQQQAAALAEKQANLDAQIAAIENDSSLTPEEKAAAVDAITTGAEYVQLEAERAVLDAQLAGIGLTVDTMDVGIAVYKTTLAQLKQRIDELEQLLTQQGVDPAALDDMVKEMEGQLAQLDAGIAGIEEGIAKIDSGMLELKDAETLLHQQKTSGLLELVDAANELAINGATVTSALAQIDSGIETLENSRKDALAAADLNNILTLDMISSILTAQNFSMPAGYVEQDGVSYMVSVGDEITHVKDMENLLLFDMGMEDVAPVHLSDVAAVLLTDNRDESYGRLNGNHSIILSFEKQSTYATAEATDNIARRFAELENEYQGLEFVALMDQGDYIYMIVDTITSSLLLGALFAIVILFLFLKDLRPTLITLCSIPVSVIFAIVLMYFSGVTINMISLSGLAVAVGMLVDNSVVVIENIYRLRAKGANAIQAAVSGASQVAGAVTASTLTTVCVFLPIVFVQGITKQLFTDLALTMTYALVASLIVALTLVPAMAQGMLRKEKKTKETVMNKFLGIYEKALRWSLKYKAVVLIVAVLLLVASAVWCLAGGFIFMPTMDMPNVNVSISMPEDVTMEEATDLADEVLARIDTLEGIETVGAMMSTGVTSLLGGGSGSMDVTVYITLSDESASGAEMGKRIAELCRDLPCEVSASSAMMDMSMLSGSGVSLQIYAEDMDALQNAAKLAAAELEKLEGVTEVSDGLEDAAPALHISVDRNAAMSKGITVAQIYMELASALTNSTTSATLQLDGTSTSVVIEKPEGAALTVADLEGYTFEVTSQLSGETTTFTLGEVATVEQTTSLNAIQRLNQRRYLTVSAGVEDGYNVTLVTGAAQRALRNVNLGKGVSYVFTGENETIVEAMEQLGLMLLLGVLLVYLVMVAQFQSLKSPFIVMFTIPLAFTGGFIGLLVCGMEFSVISMIGFIMLMGIIVNNGIVLVDYINQLRSDGMDRVEAVVDAGKTRMRPILMTTITTILGLINMAVSQSVGTSLMQPVAVVCIGGLLYATIMTLFVVPCIYDSMNKKELRTVSDEDLKLMDI